eukprot:COSAG02_NODE_1190_length_13989_cov_9.869978_6_plen_51_part_00
MRLLVGAKHRHDQQQHHAALGKLQDQHTFDQHVCGAVDLSWQDMERARAG